MYNRKFRKSCTCPGRSHSQKGHEESFISHAWLVSRFGAREKETLRRVVSSRWVGHRGRGIGGGASEARPRTRLAICKGWEHFSPHAFSSLPFFFPPLPFPSLFCFCSLPCLPSLISHFSLFLLAFKEISVQTLIEHDLQRRRLQGTHVTKNIDGASSSMIAPARWKSQKGEKYLKKQWRNVSRFMNRNGFIHSRNWANSKKDKIKEIHRDTLQLNYWKSKKKIDSWKQQKARNLLYTKGSQWN